MAPKKAPEPLFRPDAKGALVRSRAGATPVTTKQPATVAVVVDPWLSVKLREHQREGVSFMYNRVMDLAPERVPGQSHPEPGCILADAMGLGKTIQTISLVWTLLRQGLAGTPTVKRAVIVCPASLVGNWQAEFKKWLPNRLAAEAVTSTGAAAKLACEQFANLRQVKWPVLVISFCRVLPPRRAPAGAVRSLSPPARYA